MKAVAALNVYKKVAVIRKETDSLNYEDADGNVRTVSDLGHAASTAAPALTANKAKIEIPVPQIKMVESYDKDVPDNYDIKSSYVRYHRPSRAEWMQAIEYVADTEDETWLANNTKFGGASVAVITEGGEDGDTKKSEDPSKLNDSTSLLLNTATLDANKEDAETTQPSTRQQQLTLYMLEHIMDVLEKATGFDIIVSTSQAEQLIQEKVPQFTQIFPPSLTRRTVGIVTSKQVVAEVYNYWVNKRSKLKRPLLRRYWPVTSTDDTNPHFVFRPREKEKYKLRKTRRNDMLSFNKMKQLRNDFDGLRMVLDLVRKREEVYRAQVQMQCEWFDQKLFDIMDTSGKPRRNAKVKKREIDAVLTVPTYFDTQTGNKKGKRGRNKATGSRSVSPTPPVAAGTGNSSNNNNNKTDSTSALTGTAAASDAAPRIVAGHNFGQPAPSFLDPLPTRETFVTSWNRAVPHVTSYVESHALPTHRFRHRPRVGRGGRLVIDRLPCPGHPDTTPMTFLTAGKGLARKPAEEEHATQPALLPEPVDHKAVSRRIEEMSVAAVQEELELSTGEIPATEDNNTASLVLVKMEQYLNTDDQLWGEERFAIGPV
ncbi:of polycomb homolog 2 [Seminavis robusta]|uniref:Of polycomb homolog 2 n=1 Tax=Seminavis robusta TaxID=568900 RepID=A0A9N8E044_9STRA|nr:of polycomb homolog 2 [Seminavis robusta]|eukprot:Sro517_g158620.1 of polycomb homolog 2 (598) ;mRNA; r:9849-11742